jgi:Protein of unknown function (DUF3618)
MGAGADAMSAEGERDAVVIPPAEDDGGYEPGGKSPQEIENDITNTRAQLGTILDEIERQLAPRHLLERGVDMLKDRMGGEGGRFGETLRGHPVALALIGAGLGWLAMAATRGGGFGEYGGALRERVSGAMQGASERAGATAGQVREKAAGMAGGDARESSPAPYPTGTEGYAYAREKSGEAADQAEKSAQAADAKLEDTARRVQEGGGAAWAKLVDEYPLFVGALGFVAGAAIGLALPRSGAEERLMAESRKNLREQAASLGREAAERAQRVAERTVEAVRDAVREAVSGAAGAGNRASTGAEAGEKEHASAGMAEAGKNEGSP